MLSNNITITAKGNRRIKLSIYSGHFATGHAHVDRYISMTEIRSNAAMAAEAADEISKFFRCTPIDTIICLENTQVIGGNGPGKSGGKTPGKTGDMLADRGYVLENGHVVLEDTGAALLSNEAVRSAYLGA